MLLLTRVTPQWGEIFFSCECEDFGHNKAPNRRVMMGLPILLERDISKLACFIRAMLSLSLKSFHNTFQSQDQQ